MLSTFPRNSTSLCYSIGVTCLSLSWGSEECSVNPCGSVSRPTRPESKAAAAQAFYTTGHFDKTTI